NLLNDHCRVGIFRPIQEACIAALTGPQDSVAERRDTYQRRRDRVAETLGPITCEGTFYVWLKLPDHLTAAQLLTEHRLLLALARTWLRLVRRRTDAPHPRLHGRDAGARARTAERSACRRLGGRRREECDPYAVAQEVFGRGLARDEPLDRSAERAEELVWRLEEVDRRRAVVHRHDEPRIQRTHELCRCGAADRRASPDRDEADVDRADRVALLPAEGVLPEVAEVAHTQAVQREAEDRVRPGLVPAAPSCSDAIATISPTGESSRPAVERSTTGEPA